MTTTTRRSAAAVARIGSAVLLLGVAVWLWSVIPTKVQAWAPIVIYGRVGEHLFGRDLEVTVHNAVLAREVTFAEDRKIRAVRAEGAWLVADVSYAPLVRPQRPKFAVQASGYTFTGYFGAFNPDVPPGLPRRGPVAFELPNAPDSATLLVYNDVADQHGNVLTAPLDSQLAIRLDFANSPIRNSVDLDAVGK